MVVNNVSLTHNIFRIFSTTLIVIGFIILICTSLSAKTINVDDGGGAEYTSIQEAINAANISDTIQIESGTYQENIIINKTLSLIGSGKDSTFLLGMSSTQNTVKIISDYVYLSGLSIDNIQGQAMQYHSIFIQSSQYCTITDNLVKNGENGIYLISSNNNNINNNTVQNNYQKGIRLSGSNINNISNNIIQSNGDGLYTTTSYSNEVFENSIINNGIGITLSAGSNNNFVYQNDFDDNTGGNAADTGSNSWSKNSQGNYWDDYQNYDSNEDGIGDNPYSIDFDSSDPHPLGDFLTLNQNPVAIIDTISPNPSIVGDLVLFNGHGTDDGIITEWEWKSSRDGVFGTSADCSVSILSSGTHTISFRVKDDQLQWSSYDITSLIVQTESQQSTNERPIASISLIEPTETTIGEEVVFHGYGTDPDGTIIGYHWRSSIDGELSQQSSFSKTSLSVGSHTIYFKVKDNQNLWSFEDIVLLTVQETTSEKLNPVSDFNYTSQGTVNSSLLFDGSISYDTDGIITSYEWDFGDNTTGTGKIISHSYAANGNYSITLTVTDNEGQQHTTTTTISILSNSSSDTNDEINQDQKLEIPWILIVGIVVAAIIFSLFLLIILRR